MAPLDQEALARWLAQRIEDEKSHWNTSGAAGRVNAFGTFLARMKRGDLPEIDDVDDAVDGFPRVPEGLEGSPFRQGQDDAKAEILRKIRALTGEQ
ncbi:MAG: hypothetical protein JWO74_1580 [Solirubrobacterales bacterium]|nr:hypothetical protein [Solirubrobacterales bacterium]